MSFNDRDKGFKKTLAAFGKLSSAKPVITVGVHDDAGGDVLKVATINEFGGGDGNPPARSFIRAWADESEEKAKAMIRAAMLESIKTGDPVRPLKAVAAAMAGDIQNRIAGGIAPPNAESTIARKGSSTPLINTGQLRSSITGKVDGQ